MIPIIHTCLILCTKNVWFDNSILIFRFTLVQIYFECYCLSILQTAVCFFLLSLFNVKVRKHNRLSFFSFFIKFYRKLSISMALLKCHKMDIFLKTCAFTEYFIDRFNNHHCTPWEKKTCMIEHNCECQHFWQSTQENDLCANEKLFISD